MHAADVDVDAVEEEHRGAAVGPCEATYDRLPIQTLEQAQYWIASVTRGLT